MKRQSAAGAGPTAATTARVGTDSAGRQRENKYLRVSSRVSRYSCSEPRQLPSLLPSRALAWLG